MTLFQAIIYGVLQGLTEFLPISSTAHIRIVPALAGWNDPGAAFTASIQLGTLLAVLIYFRADLSQALVAWLRSFRGGDHAKAPEAKLGWAIVVGTVPIVILGVLLKEPIEGSLRSLYVISGTLIGLALLLWAAEKTGKRSRGIGTVRWQDGLIVGLFQAIALVPGASRSGSTITGALFSGFDRPTAARFSFLLSVPSILAAGVYSIVQHRAEFSHILVPIIAANAAAFVVGYASIAFLMKFLQTHSALVFIVYRLILGLAILGLIAGGLLHPLAGLPEVAGVSP